MKRERIRVLTVGGTPYEMGYQQGEVYRAEIRRYAEDRIALVREGKWSGGSSLSRQAVLDLAAACVPAHEAYAPSLFAELQGMAAATELSLAELIIVGGFTDFVDTVYGHYQPAAPLSPQLAVDDCTAFIVPDGMADGAGLFGQTWDMHDTAADFVIMLRVEPEDGPAALVFTTTGCVGQIGMNEHGIAVGINNLMGRDGQIGVTWPFVVRRVLQQDNMDDALACILEAPLGGAHNYLLFAADGRGYNVEAMSTRQSVSRLNGEAIVHTNHCLLPETHDVEQTRLPESQRSSEKRLTYAQERLQAGSIHVEDLKQLMREAPVCAVSGPPFHVESCGATIARPQTGEFWALWGLPSQNEYELFHI